MSFPPPPPGTRTEIHGHVSPDTAHVVPDYPYGFRLRCTIRYWIERDAKRGWRFASQTQNPKTGRWNAPKRGTYALIAASMYLDTEGHVHCATIDPYSEPADVAAFLRDFPHADLDTVRVWCGKKARMYLALADGRASFTINGAVATTDADRERARVDAAAWSACNA